MLVDTVAYFASNMRLAPLGAVRSGLEVIKLFWCSTQLSMKFQLLIKAKMLKKMLFLAVKLLVSVFNLLINVKMPTIVGILTLISRINFVLS